MLVPFHTTTGNQRSFLTSAHSAPLPKHFKNVKLIQATSLPKPLKRASQNILIKTQTLCYVIWPLLTSNLTVCYPHNLVGINQPYPLSVPQTYQAHSHHRNLALLCLGYSSFDLHMVALSYKPYKGFSLILLPWRGFPSPK